MTIKQYITLKPKTLATLKKDLDGFLEFRIGQFCTKSLSDIMQLRIERKYGFSIVDLFRISENGGKFTAVDK